MKKLVAIFLCLLAMAGCSYVPSSSAYRSFYAHLDQPCSPPATFKPTPPVSPYFIAFLVDARHLDYTDCRSFFLTVAKHPSDGSKSGDVGHAWIYLQGVIDGQPMYIEGGHTGETGSCQARYFDGVMNYLDYGYATPTPEQTACPRYEPNPIKYLWETQQDGFFQRDSGTHVPTCAARVNLTKEQFLRILAFVQTYNYREYSLTGSQCSSFLAHAASLAGIDLECEATMQIAPRVRIAGGCLRLWEDPCYSRITFATPDVLEKSLMDAIATGKATDAMEWYQSTHKLSKWDKIGNDARLFPKRLLRYCDL